MSWIFGIIGSQNKIEIENVHQTHGTSIFIHRTENFYIASGGIKETQFSYVGPSGKFGWIVCGIGIDVVNGSLKLMKFEDWENFLERFDRKHLQRLNGHFVIIKWNDTKIECYTDRLGLRNLYITNINKTHSLFSTRADWIARFNRDSFLDMVKFGSQWMLTNSMTDDCPVSGIARLNQSGYAIIEKAKYYYENNPWLPGENLTADSISTEEILRKVVTSPIKHNYKLSLGLSGGMDSRVLLSILLSSQLPDWGVHTVYNINIPDNVISLKMIEDFQIKHQHFESSQTNNTDLTDCSSFVGFTNAAINVSTSQDLYFYNILYNENEFSLDGGFGEIARRRYYNRILFLGGNSIKHKNIKKIKKYLTKSFSPIFTPDVMRLMDIGINKDIESLFKTMPPLEKHGLKNWLDILAIQKRLPNLAGFEQARMDNHFLSLMPYAQPLFFERIFQMKTSDRQKSILFDQIVKRNKELTQYPLVKNGIVYPYGSSLFMASVYRKLKKKSDVSIDNSTIDFLKNHQIEIQDLISSKNIKENSLYDYKFVKEIYDNFYNRNNTTVAIDLDWWLTFELYLNNISTKISLFK